MYTGAHQVVHEIVAAGHAIEHAAHEAGLFACIHIAETEGGGAVRHGRPLTPCGRRRPRTLARHAPRAKA